MIEVLRLITVGMNHWARHVHPGQPTGNRVNAGFFKHFSDGTLRWVLARVDDAGDRGPRPVVGTFDQKRLLIASNHRRDGWQPQRRMADVPTKLDDEFGDRHTHVFSRDRDRGAVNTVVSCSARFLRGPCRILLSTHQPPWAEWVKRSRNGIAMTLKKIVGMVGIAGALGFSAIGLSGVANAAPTPQATPGVVQQAQLAGWGGPGTRRLARTRLGRWRPRLARTRLGRAGRGRPAAAVSVGDLHLSEQ